MRTCLTLLLFLLFFSCQQPPKINYLHDLKGLNGQIPLRNWQVIGPFSYNRLHLKNSTNAAIISDYNFFKELKSDRSVTRKNIKQEDDFTNLNAVLNMYASAGAFAYCNIESAIDQDVALLCGIDNNASIWLNDVSIFVGSSKNITKNEYPLKVHLNKGKNSLVLGISSDKDAWGFHIDVSSLNYIHRYDFGSNNRSIASHYLIDTGHKFVVKISNPEFQSDVSYQLDLLNSANKLILNKKLGYGTEWNVDINTIDPGVYACRLRSNSDTIYQHLIYGNYKKVFNSIISTIPSHLSQSDSVSVGTLIHRFQYLDKFGAANRLSEDIERKMTAIAYDLSQTLYKLRKGQKALKNDKGYHIRSFISKIDYANNQYAIYYPENYSTNSEIPLVIIMPWVAKQHPFIESWHLAFTDRIEYIEKLARKYGFAVLWQSDRIYEKYNLNPIVAETALETFEDVKKHYSINEKKVYLYGTCSGGLQSLLMASRYPSLIAAVGVEGPELSYLKCETENGNFPQSWVMENSIINNAVNFSNIPLYLANSKNDWHGAKEPELTQFIKRLKHYRGMVTIDSIGNATRSNYVKMVNDNVVTDNIFHFFHSITNRCPDTLKFTSYQLKYNRYYWLEIQSKVHNGPANIVAYKNGKNIIHIHCSNVSRLALNTNAMPAYLNKRYLYINGIKYSFPLKKNCELNTDVKQAFDLQSKKNNITEGPISHFFSRKFLAVANKENFDIIDSFNADWKYNFFVNLPVKSEHMIQSSDLQSSNLFLCDFHYKNPIIRHLLNRLPFKFKQDYVQVGTAKIMGKNLSILYIFPNPLYRKKYVLFLGSNSNKTSPYLLKNIALNGWYDVEIIDNGSHKILFQGNFNQSWTLN